MSPDTWVRGTERRARKPVPVSVAWACARRGPEPHAAAVHSRGARWARGDLRNVTGSPQGSGRAGPGCSVPQRPALLRQPGDCTGAGLRMVAKLSAQISESKSHENPEVPTVWAGPPLTASCFSEQQSAAGAQAAGFGRPTGAERPGAYGLRPALTAVTRLPSTSAQWLSTSPRAEVLARG